MKATAQTRCLLEPRRTRQATHSCVPHRAICSRICDSLWQPIAISPRPIDQYHFDRIEFARAWRRFVRRARSHSVSVKPYLPLAHRSIFVVPTRARARIIIVCASNAMRISRISVQYHTYCSCILAPISLCAIISAWWAIIRMHVDFPDGRVRSKQIADAHLHASDLQAPIDFEPISILLMAASLRAAQSLDAAAAPWYSVRRLPWLSSALEIRSPPIQSPSNKWFQQNTHTHINMRENIEYTYKYCIIRNIEIHFEHSFR